MTAEPRFRRVARFVSPADRGFAAVVYGGSVLFAALIVPVFLYRHYIRDKGVFPTAMAEDLEIGSGEKIVNRAGIWPYVTLVAGALMFWLGSGPVKGFAVTLSIGVLTSLFSAILVTRLQIVTWLRRFKPKVIPI